MLGSFFFYNMSQISKKNNILWPQYRKPWAGIYLDHEGAALSTRTSNLTWWGCDIAFAIIFEIN